MSQARYNIEEMTPRTKKEIFTFLEKTKSVKANYQFIVLSELIKNENRSTVDQCVKALNQANTKKITYGSTPVFNVLAKKGFIKIKNDDLIIGNFPKFNTEEINQARNEINRICRIETNGNNQFTV